MVKRTRVHQRQGVALLPVCDSRPVSAHVFVQQLLDEHQSEQQDYGRNVDAAEVRHAAADRTQQRFGEAVQAVIDLADHIVRVVEYVEREQPAHDHHRDDQPEDDEDELVEQPYERLHLGDPRELKILYPARQRSFGLGAKPADS